MYKSGKNWLVVGIAATAVTATLANTSTTTVHADSVSTATKQANNNQTTANDVANAKSTVDTAQQHQQQAQAAVSQATTKLNDTKQALKTAQANKYQATPENIAATSAAVDTANNVTIPADKNAVASATQEQDKAQSDAQTANDKVKAAQTDVDSQQKVVDQAHQDVENTNAQTAADNLNKANQAVSKDQVAVQNDQQTIDSTSKQIPDQRSAVTAANEAVNAAQNSVEVAQSDANKASENKSSAESNVKNDQQVVTTATKSAETATTNLNTAQTQLDQHNQFDRNAAKTILGPGSYSPSEILEGTLENETQLPNKLVMPQIYQQGIQNGQSTTIQLYCNDGKVINYTVPLNGSGYVDPFYQVRVAKDNSPKLKFNQDGVLDAVQAQELTAYALELINSVRVPLGLPALKMNSLTVLAGQAMALDRAKTNTSNPHVDAQKDIDGIIGENGFGQNASMFSVTAGVDETGWNSDNNTMLFAKANLVNTIISMIWNDFPSNQGHAKSFLSGNANDLFDTYMSLSITSPDLQQAAGGYNIAFNLYIDGSKINNFPDLPVNDTAAGVEDTVAIQLQNAVTKAKATNQEAITNLHNAENKLTQDQVILETANTNYNTANQMLTAAQKNLTSKQSALHSAQKGLSTSQQALQQAQSSLKDNAAQLSNDQVTQSHAQAVVDNLDSTLKEKIALLNSAETKLNNLTKVLNEAKNDYENKQAILKVANNKLSDAKANLANDLKNLATLQEKLSTLTNADSLLATAKSNLASAKAQFDQANAALESATSELTTAQGKYNTIKMDYDAELAVQKELAVEAQKEAQKANKGQKSSISLNHDSDAQTVTQNGNSQYVELSNMITISPKIRPAAETASQVKASSVFASSANSLLTRLPQTGEQNGNLWISIISSVLSLAALFGIRKHYNAAHLSDSHHA